MANARGKRALLIKFGAEPCNSSQRFAEMHFDPASFFSVRISHGGHKKWLTKDSRKPKNPRHL
jgi:hypothetical protein